MAEILEMSRFDQAAMDQAYTEYAAARKRAERRKH